MMKEFTAQLEGATVAENASASFTCQTNDEEADVTWEIDHKPLPDSDKYKKEDEGITHTLTISDLTPQDSCEVSATFGDQSTSASLVVEGTGLSICFYLHKLEIWITIYTANFFCYISFNLNQILCYAIFLKWF